MRPSQPADRRRFLQRGGALAATALLPGWLAGCRRAAGLQSTTPAPPPAAEPDDPFATDDPLEATRRAAARARRHGRPLLLLAIPKDDSEQWRRGTLFGVWLHHLDGLAAAELAACDLWCAPLAELRAVAPKAHVADETIALLLEPDGTTIRELAGPLDRLPNWRDAEEEGVEFDEYERRLTTLQRAAIAAFATRLRTLLVPDEAALAARAEAEVAALALREPPPPDLREGAPPTEVHARLAPNWLLRRALGATGAAQESWLRLAEMEVTRRWRAAPPPRMRWTNGEGCGSVVEYVDGDPELEEDDGLRIACGMAFVPEYSARFLTFYVRRDEER